MEQASLFLEGKYEIVAKIREGGMGTIYKVRHRLLEEIRVIKVMRPSAVGDKDLKRRFLEEARTATRLKHPNICSIYDFAADDNGTAYLVMEYIDGITLAELLKSGGLPAVPLALQIAHQTLLALGYLHRRGVIHRDIAPDNLMLTYDEEHRAVVKLIDLGIAKIVDRDLDMTATGVFLGKPRYASPEQFGMLASDEKLDGRSDLYGLGIVLYELLTGIRPYAGKSPLEILKAQHLNLLIPFEESDPMGRVPPDLRSAVFKALSRRREDRFATAEEFDRELVRLLNETYGQRELGVNPATLSSIRDSQLPTARTPTPGAQEHLDRHFSAQATPSPSLPPLTLVPNDIEPPAPLHTIRLALEPRPLEERQAEKPYTVSSPFLDHTAVMSKPAIRSAPREENDGPGPSSKITSIALPSIGPPSSVGRGTTTTPEPATGRDSREIGAPPSLEPSPTMAPEPAIARESRESSRFQVVVPRRRMAVPLLVIAASVAAILLWHPWSQRTVSEISASAVARPEPQPPVGPEPQASARTESQALPNVEVAPSQGSKSEPAPAEGAEASAAPAAPSTDGVRERLTKASAEAVAARKEADDARGSDFAPTTYKKAVAKQASAANLSAEGQDAEATQLLDEASELFHRAAAMARDQAHRKPYADSVSKPPEAPAKPSPPAVAPAPPPSQESLDPAIAAESRKRINQVIGDYAWALRTRNARLYAQVYPTDSARFRQLLGRFDQLDVRMDVQSIDFQGARAVASVKETLIGRPREGDEVHTDTDIRLELAKQGGRWVIVKRI